MEHSEEVDLFEYHNVNNQEILISYKGPFDKYIISKLGKKVKNLTADNPVVSKKVFKIFIELAQNVSYYSSERSKLSDEKNTGVGSLIIGENDKHYIFATGNVIKNEEIEILSKKSEIINSLNRKDLRQYKRDQRNLINRTNGGANIGLIMTALITGKKLDAKFTEIDEKYSYFTITVRISKSNT